MDAFKNLAQVKLIDIGRLEENTGQLRGVPENPRYIEADKFALLKQDIQDYPEFLKYNPLKVFQLESGNYIIIGGNMRYRALSEIGVKQIPCVVFDSSTSTEKLKAYALLDNNGFGQYDWEKLKAGGWGDDEQLTAWGVDLPSDWNLTDEDNIETEDDGNYSRKVVAPTYEPSGSTPTFGEMYDTTKRDELLAGIDKSDLPDDVRVFLQEAARRHTVFNYAKIADYYAQASAEIQALMERSALVIIDFDKAIEGGIYHLDKRPCECVSRGAKYHRCGATRRI